MELKDVNITADDTLKMVTMPGELLTAKKGKLMEIIIRIDGATPYTSKDNLNKLRVAGQHGGWNVFLICNPRVVRICIGWIFVTFTASNQQQVNSKERANYRRI